VTEFNDIARCSLGDPALGYLKMDVDNLGYVFPLRHLAAEDAILRFEEFGISHGFRLPGSGTVRAPRPLKS
jgi:hypothetical protein